MVATHHCSVGLHQVRPFRELLDHLGILVMIRDIHRGAWVQGWKRTSTMTKVVVFGLGFLGCVFLLAKAVKIWPSRRLGWSRDFGLEFTTKEKLGW